MVEYSYSKNGLVIFVKRFFSFFLFLLMIQAVSAASTCDYSEQVRLQRSAANVKMSYEIRNIWYDQNGNVFTEGEGIENNALYTPSSRVYVYFLNVTNALNGEVEFDAGDLSNIHEYKIRILSNSSRCMGDNLRTSTIFTPMYNVYHEQTECKYIPNYEYCKEYITSPILATAEVVRKRTGEAYNRYLNNIPVETVVKEVPFWDQIGFWFQNVWIYFALALGLFFLMAIVVIIVVIRKRKKEIL